eukprot:TRINITY_DN6482_c0_g1_i2.p1 TRINITY_DN6482_c0_g1~~TRINITY_DN6482_c0_g1_i2.p1  ORF type:complete len:364 (+),score=58.45 TRINITY_DN6482_c0_g1_i2:267-1358(+)
MSYNLPSAERESRWLTTMGFLAMFGVIVFWVTMSEVSETFTRSRYNKPGFGVWISHVGLSVLIPIVALSCDFKKQGVLGLYRDNFGPLKRQIWVFLVVALIYFACMYTWIVAFGFTSCSSSSAVYQTAAGFTLLFSVLLLGEQIHGRKMAAIGVTMVGVSFIVWPLLLDDARAQGPNPALGDWLTLLSSALCGLYNVAYKILTCKEEFKYGPHHPEATLPLGASVIRTLLCLGGLGLAFIPLGVVLVVFHFTGIETFELPMTREDIMPMVVNSAIMPFYDFCFAMALQLNTPMIASFAMSFVVPTTFCADWVIHGMPIPVEALFGAVIVAAGLAMMEASYGSDKHTDDKVAPLLPESDAGVQA